MALVTLEDINVHLPSDKLWLSEADAEQLQIDAERTIKGYLAGDFSSATLAAWVSPVTTPGMIRAIAGRLIAAKWYAIRTSEEGVDSDFAQNLYNEAMQFLRDVKSGAVVMSEVAETPGQDITGFPDGTDGEPIFTMDLILG